MLASFAAVVGLSLVAVPTAATAADQTLVRTAVADTYVLWSSPTSSFGGESVLKISRTSFHAFVGFDSGLPAGSTVTSASLRLYVLRAPDYVASRCILPPAAGLRAPPGRTGRLGTTP
jgi:hypothetical protein